MDHLPRWEDPSGKSSRARDPAMRPARGSAAPAVAQARLQRRGRTLGETRPRQRERHWKRGNFYGITLGAEFVVTLGELGERGCPKLERERVGPDELPRLAD